MRPRLTRALLPALGAIAMTAAFAGADEAEIGGVPRVRGASTEAVQLLQELVSRSTTGRDLVTRLERSDLLVFVRYEWFQSHTLRGRIGFLAASRRARVFAIEISSHLTRNEQLASLAHELQHAVEIAGAASVHDTRSLAAFYTSIGEPTGSPGAETFETAAAAATGRRVRQELLSPTAAADDPGVQRH